MASSTPSRSALAEINITPLVDVMLVLLVIFMVTAPMVARPITASLPQASIQRVPDKPRQMDLRVDVAGIYRLDERPVSLAELALRLEQAHAADPRMVLTVESAAGADYQQLVSAIAVAHDSGLRNISIRN